MAPSDPSPKARIWAAIVLTMLVAIGLWLRLQVILLNGGLERTYNLWADRNYFGGITDVYTTLAAALRERRAFPSAIYPPGYPVFLALQQAIGLRLQQIRVVQALVDVGILVPATYAICRRIGIDRRFSVIAAATTAIHPLFVAGSGLLTAEALTPALVAGAVWLALVVAQTPRSGAFAALGIWLGVATLIRPDLALLAPVLGACLWMIVRQTRSTTLLLVFAISFCGVLAPWGLYNRVAHGAWVFTSTSGSTGLWQGLGELPNSYGYTLGDTPTNAMLRGKGLAPHSIEADRYLQREYLRAWREHPAFVAGVVRERWKKILTASEHFTQIAWLNDWPPVFDRYGAFVWLLACVLAVLQPTAWIVFAVPVLYALLSIGLVHYEARYVRYVDWAYVIAAVFVVWTAVKATASPVVARVLVALSCVALVLLGARDVPNLRRAVREARLRRLMDDPAYVQSIPSVEGQPWQPEPGTSTEKTDAGLRFDANPGRFEYISTRRYDVRAAEFVAMSYDVTVEHGGITIGIQDNSRAWLDSTNCPARMRCLGTLGKLWPGGEAMTIVLARDNPAGDRTIAELHALSVHYVPR